MNKYVVTRAKTIAQGLNFRWVEEEYSADRWHVDDCEQLHLRDEVGHNVVSFARGHWSSIVKVFGDQASAVKGSE